MTAPRISVIMPVYNAESYLKEAIDSVLGQSFKEFELIIIDDASIDNSVAIVESFVDKRIILIKKDKNTGITDSLNKAIQLCKGKYIARMDADDISVVDRFKKQFDYMEANPSVLVLGTMYRFIDSDTRLSHLPLKHDEIKLFALTQNPVAHPTVFIRKTVFEQFKLKYDKERLHVEDYDLWTKVLNIGKIENLPDVLLLYRRHENQISSLYQDKQLDECNYIRLAQLNNLIDFKNKSYDGDFAVRALVEYGWNEITSDDLVKVNQLLIDIWEANKIKKIYNEVLLLAFLKKNWTYYILRLRKYKIKNLVPILKDPLNIKSFNKLFAFHFIMKALLKN